MNSTDVLAIIPARGGSKGLPHKNLYPIKGKPLILYTIEAALQAKNINNIIVSTDCDEIAKIVRIYKRIQIIKRPSDLAQDTTPTLPVLLHVLSQIPTKDIPRKVIILQPTSPLREVFQIEEAIDTLTPEFDACVSVCAAEHSPYKMFKITQGVLLKLIREADYGVPRQLLPQVYRENGAIYVTWTNVLITKGSIWGDKTLPYIMSEKTSIDIDTLFDVLLAETILEERINEK